jgi:hypothetical protein
MLMREPAQHPYSLRPCGMLTRALRGFVKRKPASVSTLMQNALPFDGNRSAPSGLSPIRTEVWHRLFGGEHFPSGA